MLEVEVKIRITDREALIKSLEALGFIKGTSVYEMDIYYNGKLSDLKAEDKALRIREHKDLDTGIVRYIINFKGPKLDDVTMTRDETQFDIPSFEHGNKIINGLGFFAAGKVEKTRIHYVKDDICCCLDNVTDLGDYLEVEIMAEDEDKYKEAVRKIELLLEKLGFSMDDTSKMSYLSMLQ